MCRELVFWKIICFVNSKYKFFGDDVDDIQLKHKDYEHIAKYPFTTSDILGFKENNSPVLI
jgi:hypothetical protein